jgi:hypothetical protein
VDGIRRNAVCSSCNDVAYPQNCNEDLRAEGLTRASHLRGLATPTQALASVHHHLHASRPIRREPRAHSLPTGCRHCCRQECLCDRSIRSERTPSRCVLRAVACAVLFGARVCGSGPCDHSRFRYSAFYLWVAQRQRRCCVCTLHPLMQKRSARISSDYR